VDVLVNAAAITSRGTILDVDEGARDRTLHHMAQHIRVNAVIPGSTRAGINGRRSEAVHELIGRHNVSGRVNDPDDVAKTMALVLSEDAATISRSLMSVR